MWYNDAVRIEEEGGEGGGTGGRGKMSTHKVNNTYTIYFLGRAGKWRGKL